MELNDVGNPHIIPTQSNKFVIEEFCNMAAIGSIAKYQVLLALEFDKNQFLVPCKI